MTLDAYVWRARIAPWLVIISPVMAIAVGTAFLNGAVALGSATVALAVALLGSQIARDAGRDLQARLWRKWGGAPTSARLRFRDGQLSEAATQNLHDLVNAATGKRLATKAEEDASAENADRGYEEAVASLREQTRERPPFDLVFSENCDYGFRRNLTALKGWGIAVSLVALAGATVWILVGEGPTGSKLASVAPAVALSCGLLAVYSRVTDDQWVRKAGERYADSLFGAARTLAARRSN